MTPEQKIAAKRSDGHVKVAAQSRGSQPKARSATIAEGSTIGSGNPTMFDPSPPDAEASAPPVSPATIMRMASHYLARHGASTARLRAVLGRKIRRRCEARGLPPPPAEDVRGMIEAAVERLTRAGLLDDAAYGRGRAGALARKGLPAWRIERDLQDQGIDVEAGAVAEALDLDPAAQARRFAGRKRLGPFRAGERERFRDKDLRALLRAGFSLGVAKSVLAEAGDDA